MKVPFFNMTAGQMAKSKAMLGGFILLGLGGYLVAQAQYELGAGVIGNAIGLMGIRDAK